MNHWIAAFTRLISDARAVSAVSVLGPLAQTCRTERRVPDFVAVNYADIGDVVGVVRSLNGLDSRRLTRRRAA